VQVGTHKFVLLSAYKSYDTDKHLYLHVLSPLEAVCPYVSGAPKHRATQYRDVGSEKPKTHVVSHFLVELSIKNPEGHKETHFP